MAKTFKYILDFAANSAKFQQEIGGITGILKGAGVAFGAAFTADKIKDAAIAIVQLSGEAQGVVRAFNSIADASYMRNLQKATHGTVSELELMKRAVSANNFQIPLEQLGSLLEFASARAQQTGGDVNYLVDSIVTGIGRKSPMILDNLGISASRLSEKLNGASFEASSIGDMTKAVAAIAREELGKMGGYAEDAASQIKNISVQWQDFQLHLSQNEGFKVFISDNLSEWQRFTDVIFSDAATLGEKWRMAFAANENVSKRIFDEVQAREEQTDAAIKAVDSYSKMIEMAKKGVNQSSETVSATKKEILTYGDIISRISEKNNILKQTDVTQTGFIARTYAEIAALEKQKAAFEALATVTKPAERDTTSYQTISTKQEFDVGATAVEIPGLADMGSFLDENAKKTERFREELKLANEEARNSAFSSLGESFGSLSQSIGGAAGSFFGFASNMASLIPQLISQVAALGVAQVAQSTATASAKEGEALASGIAASQSVPFPLNLIALAATVAAIVSSFSQVKKFAAGGIAYGPTLGLFGEYPGASSNPEIIAPLSDLEEMIEPAGGGTVILQPGIDMDGDRLRVFLNRMENKAYKRT